MSRKVSTTCAQTYVLSDSHAHSALGWSGKLPSECVLRGHEEREGNDTPGRRDSISTLRHKERVRLCGFRGEEGKVWIEMNQGVWFYLLGPGQPSKDVRGRYTGVPVRSRSQESGCVVTKL